MRRCKHSVIRRKTIKGHGNTIFFICQFCSQQFIPFLNPQITGKMTLKEEGEA